MDLNSDRKDYSFDQLRRTPTSRIADYMADYNSSSNPANARRVHGGGASSWQDHDKPSSLSLNFHPDPCNTSSQPAREDNSCPECCRNIRMTRESVSSFICWKLLEILWKFGQEFDQQGSFLSFYDSFTPIIHLSIRQRMMAYYHDKFCMSLRVNVTGDLVYTSWLKQGNIEMIHTKMMRDMGVKAENKKIDELDTRNRDWITMNFLNFSFVLWPLKCL